MFLPRSLFMLVALGRCRAFLRPRAAARPAARLHSTSASASYSTKVSGLEYPAEVVTVDYTLAFEDGSEISEPAPLFDVGEDVRFVVPNEMFLKGLNDMVRSMEVGESRTETLSPGDAFGESVAEMRAELPIDQAPKGMKLGDKLRLWTGETVRVAAMDGDTFTIDGNALHAGKKVVCSATLKERRSLEDAGIEHIDVAGGCFWGLELHMQRLRGVVGTAPGYQQGTKVDPTYEEICGKGTGHTESVRVWFDPKVISLREVLEAFAERTDLTTKDRQGNDVGPNYRSGIYFGSEAQEAVAREVLANEFQKTMPKEIVAECEEAGTFYFAEKYHACYLLKGGQSAKKDETETVRCYG